MLFQASFRRVSGELVTCSCFMIFQKSVKTLKITKKFVKHHQVTSTPETLRKLAWNHLMVSWLNFEENQRFLFCKDRALVMTQGQCKVRMTTKATSTSPYSNALSSYNCRYQYLLENSQRSKSDVKLDKSLFLVIYYIWYIATLNSKVWMNKKKNSR